MNDLVVGDPGVIPVVYRPRVDGDGEEAASAAERLGQRFLGSARLVPRDLMRSRTGLGYVEASLGSPAMPERDWPAQYPR